VPQESIIHVTLRLAVAAYLFWAGMFLVMAPWMASWNHNYFALLVPSLGPWMTNAFVRGAITGIGLVTTVAGIREIAGAFAGSPPDRNASSDGKPSAP
jgi:hypothetical protein